jgi:hypothetical protein
VSQSPISIGGFPLPSDAPQFLGVLAVHIAGGIWCVITGAIAMLSEKQPGRHPRFGTFYFWGLVVVFITMSILSAMRWAEDYILFVFGALSLGSAMVGRQAAPSRSMGRIRVHVVAMAASYILLLTAFYVDNGKNLPVWRSLPHIAYWLIPSAFGLPIIFRVLRHHPLLKAEQARGEAGRAA